MCFSSPSIPPLQPAPVALKADAPEVQAAGEKEKELARMRKGRSSTILTSLVGSADGGSGKGKTLLGS